MNLNGNGNGHNGHDLIEKELLHILPVAAKQASKADKIKAIEYHFREIMLVLGLDMEDDSLKDTPRRVAAMYVNELFSGLDPANEPAIALFENKHQYGSVIIEKDIPFYSSCEHHFVPISGKAHIAYIPKDKVIGLSKLNRVLHYFARRPQLQEKMTMQVAEYLKKILATEDVAVIVDAEHLCIAARGVKDHGSRTLTSSFSGKFLNTDKKNEVYRLLNI